jgi:DNA-binding response OmpR family regulator
VDEAGSSEQVVLIVDRDRRYRHGAARALYLAGWEVLEAASGEEALDITSKHDLTLAVIQTRLIGISGPELARRLQALHGDEFPILLVADEWSEQLDGAAVGEVDRLVRPSTPDDLHAAVRQKLAAPVADPAAAIRTQLVPLATEA